MVMTPEGLKNRKESLLVNLEQRYGLTREQAIERHKEIMRQRGSLGGKAETDKPKGFAAIDKELHKELSTKGGRISRPRKVL